jgi:hypothetical protein
MLQQDLHGNTASRLFNIYSYIMIIVAVTSIPFILFLKLNQRLFISFYVILCTYINIIY